MSEEQGQRKKLRIGDVLIQAGLLTDAQLGLALQEQKRAGTKLGRTVVDMGFVTEVRLLKALSEQLQVPFIELKHFKFNQELIQKLPETMARRYRALVLAKEPEGLRVAMSDPLDLMAMDALEHHLKDRLLPAVVREGELVETLELVYRRTSEIASIAGELEEDLADSDFDLARLSDDSNTEAPVVRLLQTLFEDAVQMKASDIHIEPDEGVVRIRQRIDGVLNEQVMKETHRLSLGDALKDHVRFGYLGKTLAAGWPLQYSGEKPQPRRACLDHAGAIRRVGGDASARSVRRRV